MNIDKEITKPIANEFDRGATSIQITGINEADNALFCNLYADGVLLVSNRIFSLDNLPCNELTAEEKDCLNQDEVILNETETE